MEAVGAKVGVCCLSGCCSHQQRAMTERQAAAARPAVPQAIPTKKFVKFAMWKHWQQLQCKFVGSFSSDDCPPIYNNAIHLNLEPDTYRYRVHSSSAGVLAPGNVDGVLSVRLEAGPVVAGWQARAARTRTEVGRLLAVRSGCGRCRGSFWRAQGRDTHLRLVNLDLES